MNQQELSDTLQLYIASASGAYLQDPDAGDDSGIFRVALDLTSGAMQIVDEIKAIPSSQYLNFSPDQRFLYATHYDRSAPKGQSSFVYAFAVDAASGALRYLNRQPAAGDSPCYVSVDPTGKYLLLVNYTGPEDWGSIFVFALNEDGSIAQPTCTLQHAGSSVNTQRQSKSHPHMILSDPTGKLILIPDLGIDKVVLYKLDGETGQLHPHDPAWLSLEPGAGPRHLAFTPDQRYMYVINELDSSITGFSYNSALQNFNKLDRYSTLPATFQEWNSCADIHVAPSGRFLYGSNRGHDSIAIYAIDPTTGELDFVAHESTRGHFPRAFYIEPGGQFLIVANQNSDTVFSFRIDPESGRLHATGHQISIPEPLGVKSLRQP